MQRIVDVYHPGLRNDLVREALEAFFELRELPGLKKKPSTSELLDWLKLLVAEDIPLEALQSKDDKVAVPPLVGALQAFDVLQAERLEPDMFARQHQVGRGDVGFGAFELHGARWAEGRFSIRAPL